MNAESFHEGLPISVLMMFAPSAAPSCMLFSGCSSRPDVPARSMKITAGRVVSFCTSVLQLAMGTTLAASRLYVENCWMNAELALS